MRRLFSAMAVCVMVTTLTHVEARDNLAPDLRARIDAIATEVLNGTGVPSASVAIVRHSVITYVRAYGWGQLEPRRAASPEMRYAVGSISKEFTATGLLLLQERGSLSLDDPAGKWLIDLGPARGATIRSLLSHTSGIRDYWPQDYDPPDTLKPVDPVQIVHRWARQSLDFPTGTSWQYSNTGYTVAGLIAERAAHQPLFQFLQKNLFAPFGMKSVFDFDAAPLPAGDAMGYTRYALGPPRPAAKEGRGWLFAAGELAMTASDLALWDIALIKQRALTAASYRELTTEVQLRSGVGTGYGLGLFVDLDSGKRVLKHSGEVGGFTAENRIYPDEEVAIVVLINQDATDASATMADAIARVVLEGDSPEEASATREARQLFEQLQGGHIDLSRLTANARSYFTNQALADFRDSLGPLRKPQRFELKKRFERGGLINRTYEIEAGGRKLQARLKSEPNGLIEQFTVDAL